MELVQDGLKARQDRSIQGYRERPFPTRFVLSLGEEALQLDELDLQMELPRRPFQGRVSNNLRTRITNIHSHELSDPVVQVRECRRSEKRCRLVRRSRCLCVINVRVFSFIVAGVEGHQPSIQPADIETKAIRSQS